MPLLNNVSTLAAAIETTPGTAETLAGTDMVNAAVRNVTVNVDIEKTDRKQSGTFVRMPSATGTQTATISFQTDLMGKGDNTSPVWADQLWPACGLVNTSGEVWTATGGEAVGTNVKTLTMEFCVNGIRHTLAGAIGTCTISGQAGKPCMIDWEFQGKYLGKSDAAVLSTTHQTRQPMRYAGASSLVWGSYEPCTNSFSWELGNTLFLRPCQGTTDETGIISGEITDRVTTIQLDPESDLVATAGLFADWEAATTRSLSIVATDGTDKLTLAATNVEIITAAPGDRGGLHIEQYTLQPTGALWTATFAAA